MKINGDLLIDDNLPLSCVKTNKNDIDEPFYLMVAQLADLL